MEERRKMCTDHDSLFRIKKEYIDAVLETYDKEFNKKLHELKLIPSKQYLEDLQKLPPGLIELSNTLLKSLGFKHQKNSIKNQTDLSRILEESIAFELPDSQKPILGDYLAKTLEKTQSGSLPKILLELFGIIYAKKCRKDGMEEEYKELYVLQKKTAEDQAYLISSKRVFFLMKILETIG